MKNSLRTHAETEQNPDPAASKKAAGSRLFRRESSTPDAGNEIWLLTLADVFMLLMICFVLLFGMSLYRQKETAAAAVPPAAAMTPDPAVKAAPVQEASSLESELLAVLGQDRQSVTVERRSTYVVISFPEHILFDSGQAEVKVTVQPLLKKVASVILNHPGLAVAIHGHTDDRPIHNRRYPSNWELSVDRAARVAGTLVQMGIAPAHLSLKGFGEDRPLHANDSDDNRLKNRRVEIQFSLVPSGT
jgi:chemotaxis protein MotB